MEQIEHPSHYNGSCAFECWDLMEMVFGQSGLYTWCVVNAFKYCYRCKAKHSENPAEDLLKAKQCMDKAKTLELIEPSDHMGQVVDFLTEWIDTKLAEFNNK